MKFIMKYLRPFYAVMILGLTIKVLGTIVELALPYILSYILKNVVEKQQINLMKYCIKTT